MVAAGGEFERWLILLDKNKDASTIDSATQKINAAILADPRLYHMYQIYPACSFCLDNKDAGSNAFTAIRRLTAVSIESHYELKKAQLDQFKIFLRSPNPTVYEAFWLMLAALIRKSNAGDQDNGGVLARVRMLQENRLHDRAISISIEGFPTGEIGPRRAAMLYVLALCQQDTNVVVTNYGRLLPFLRDLLPSKRIDPVILTLVVHCLHILAKDPVHKKAYLDSGLFEQTWELLSRTCDESFEEEFFDYVSSSHYSELCRSIRMEATNIIKSLMKDNAFSTKPDLLALIQKCEAWIWIVKNSDHDEEIAQV
ncbi:UNVERIFIED_CONTAM: hypothetical protein HDU68_012283 [Siphonaria sp. JEL0065]|nr:hypothetical protein HDU68_012283 [Siphonaria sp. JEL0065]